jgi:hypothetical protein
MYTERYPSFRCVEISQHDIGYLCEQCAQDRNALRDLPQPASLKFEHCSTVPLSEVDSWNHNPPLILPRLVKKFPSLYGIQIFIIVL